MEKDTLLDEVTIARVRAENAALKFYHHEFADGYVCVTPGFDRVEMQHETMRHGRLISKTPA